MPEYARYYANCIECGSFALGRPYCNGCLRGGLQAAISGSGQHGLEEAIDQGCDDILNLIERLRSGGVPRNDFEEQMLGAILRSQKIERVEDPVGASSRQRPRGELTTSPLTRFDRL